jgi:hypothetical protein
MLVMASIGCGSRGDDEQRYYFVDEAKSEGLRLIREIQAALVP